MSNGRQLVRFNLRVAKDTWGEISKTRLIELKALTRKYSLCVALGDVQLLDQRWYVTGAGLLRLSERRHCTGIKVQQVARFCDPSAGRWVFKATIYKNLEMICADFLAGANLDAGNPDALVFSLYRVYNLLPQEYQLELLKEIKEKPCAG